MTVRGVVLGAGLSTRLGRTKQSLPFGDTTLLGWAVAQAEASRLDDVIVVIPTGVENPPTRRAAVATNPTPARGTLSSLLIGAGGRGPVMVLLGDMPGITAIDIDRILEAWHADPRWAAVAQYLDGPGHPLLLSEALLAGLDGTTGDKVLWPMLQSAPPSEVLRVDMGKVRPRDVDTEADYVAACREAGFEPS